MMLVSLSLLGVVAARIDSQHQLVIGQKISSEVAVSATGTAEVQADTTMKINVGDVGRFKQTGTNKWLHCPDIIRSDGNEEAYCKFKSNPLLANVWKMQEGGTIDRVPQYQFVDMSTKRCLMRQSCHSSTSAMSLSDPTRYWDSDKDCNHCGTKHWTYNARQRKLSEHTGRNCVQSTGGIAHCKKTHQRLDFVSGKYVAPKPVEPIRKFQCVSRAQAIAIREQNVKTESEEAINAFEEQMFDLKNEAERQAAKANKLRIATGILGGVSSVAKAIPVVGGAAAFLTKCAGKATACAAAAADREQAKAEHESLHVHMYQLGHEVRNGVAEIKSALLRIQAENQASDASVLIASISQYFIDMQVKADAIYKLEWFAEDLVFAAKDIHKAYKQIGLTYAQAREVDQFLASMRECILDSTGQLVESKTELGVIAKHKSAMESALQNLRDDYQFLRDTLGQCKQNRMNRAHQRNMEAQLARHNKELAKVQEATALRRAESEERRQEAQDTDGFTSASEGVSCKEYSFVAECKKVLGGKKTCEEHCTNYHTLGLIENEQRYRCRWQGKDGCRSSTGRLKFQKCKRGTCNIE